MSLSVRNGGIGKSPAISRISRLSPQKESEAITKKMHQSVQQKETRANIGEGASGLSTANIWIPSVPAAINPCYPSTEVNLMSLNACVSAIAIAKTDGEAI